MGGNKVECKQCGTHPIVVGAGDAAVIHDTHRAINRSHEVAIVPTELRIGVDMRELDTASFVKLVDLMQGASSEE